MVDVVFQLLVFFIFTFQIRVMERYYWVRVAKTKAAQVTPESKPPKVKLQSRPDGELQAILLDEKPLQTPDDLAAELLRRPRSPESQPATVFVTPVGVLKYRNVVAVTMAIQRAGWAVALMRADSGAASSPSANPSGQPDPQSTRVRR